MKRRTFLRDIPAWIAGASALMTPPRAIAAPVRLLLQESPLAGFQYHAAPAAWGELAIGDALVLVREPRNRYDTRAVSVCWNGRMLGYIPRIENTAVAQLLDRGERVCASIADLCESQDPWKRLRIAVFIDVYPQ